MPVLTFEYPKARKAHQCQVCGCEIELGTTYHRQAGVYDGSWQSWWAHSDCAEMHWHHNDGRMEDDQCDDYYLSEYRGFWPHAVCRIERWNDLAKIRRDTPPFPAQQHIDR